MNVEDEDTDHSSVEYKDKESSRDNETVEDKENKGSTVEKK